MADVSPGMSGSRGVSPRGTREPRGGEPAPVRGGALVSGPRSVVLNDGATFVVSADDGSISPQTSRLGLYSDDTRFLSQHDLRINGRRLHAVGSSRLSYRHARWLYTVDHDPAEARPVDRTIAVTLDRTLGERRMHEDIGIQEYGGDEVTLLLTLQIESDFADLFEVRSERWQQRTSLATTWTRRDGLETRYVRDDFLRRCVLRVASGQRHATYANGRLQVPVHVTPHEGWRLCLQYDLISRDGDRPAIARCPLQSPVIDHTERLRRSWQDSVSRVRRAEPRLQTVFDQAVDDFAALRLLDHDFSKNVPFPAAGIPWFVAPFGRDSIIASLQTLPVHPMFAVGTLQTLAKWQATADDAGRDAEPGKIPHELRVGEWAKFGTAPEWPYYGTADATPLYLMLLGSAYRWLGDAEMLRPFRDTACRCLDWIDRSGDLDGDGFQEYRPRAPGGYRNQCWRDAEDGVLDEQGNYPPHPIGTCDMQAYVYAAKRGMAGLFGDWGDHDVAARLPVEAEALRRRFIDAWWLEDEGTVAFAMDGNKRLLRTHTANPGHCLWLGMLDGERGRRAAARLMEPELFSGWGLRSLSAAHPRYDPHSYQRGGVWPHDTMLTAAGLRRYGLRDECWRLIDALLSAAVGFERAQIPELFAGLARGRDDAPMPYEHANTPQAWAAGTPFHAVRILLGLEPDAPAQRIYVDPQLPPWCPEIEMENVRVGNARVNVRAWRRRDGSSDVDV
ncbi:MAG: amylo-alpha-1,6-glucosidase, partial [Candidatus Dormibacteraeota bacterium]|nr:amylo-alpha-1,6-glucosidase [Candidatus Dormibacteraeota bacterium]